MILKTLQTIFQFILLTRTASAMLENITFSKFRWLNEPKVWSADEDSVLVVTDEDTDFWQKTWYNFSHNSGHVFGVDIQEDFTFEIQIEANFSHLYDQAGLMIYVNEHDWLKTGIEYNDGQPMIGSVLTHQVSDWATGIFNGDPKKFWLRLSKVRDVICVKYSIDNVTWTLLRLAPFPIADSYFIGPMCCTPMRKGLEVKFSNMVLKKPADDILHSN